ncbi:hypothetical protein FIBSPDRAFT_384199 [Athelia psychrophila]|uniref:Uncharacterized protein n=1 Tax=Athelia psychrophila TaxID=1759441 RepID=A0A166P0A9_9AGAM|nr:hypothetical protein FIBSPDRAFT_384199 [Fibularhizoctonia sp. CBS 109695]
MAELILAALMDNGNFLGSERAPMERPVILDELAMNWSANRKYYLSIITCASVSESSHLY